MRRLIFAIALAALLASAPGAAANGDPPSDVLPFEHVYVPSEPASPTAIADLRDAVKRARAAGYLIKVAVIQSEVDLGPLALLFRQPQRYADYMIKEIPRHGVDTAAERILVVMPSGAGIAGPGFGPDERKVARTIQVAQSATSTALVQAATSTVERMAAAAGKPIGGAGGSGGSGGGAIAPILVGVLLLGAAVAGIAARRRQGAGAPPAPGKDPSPGDE
ncbi:MAG: hypothetical protein QOJ97_3089 [Solirubrobacteraceae bacterium]|jgi:hypothetical protein|nr:hypothetical protein [Solirubrobacteraceae bacterium]